MVTEKPFAKSLHFLSFLKKTDAVSCKQIQTVFLKRNGMRIWELGGVGGSIWEQSLYESWPLVCGSFASVNVPNNGVLLRLYTLMGGG
jgi:hypothetical protein